MASGLIASCWSRFANASAITGASPSAWSGWRCVRKIAPIVSDATPACASRRAVPMPQSIRYGRPSTISSVAGSDRSARSGGPPAVPSIRICVSCCPATDLGAAGCAEIGSGAPMTHDAMRTRAPRRAIMSRSLHPNWNAQPKLVRSARFSEFELQRTSPLGRVLDVPRLTHPDDLVCGPRGLRLYWQVEAILGDEPPADEHGITRDLRDAVRSCREVERWRRNIHRQIHESESRRAARVQHHGVRVRLAVDLERMRREPKA